MDKQHVAVILGMVSKIYGKQVDSTDAEITIELWHRYLCDEPDDLVQLAFDQYIAGNVFAPKPSEILELIEKAKSKLFADRYISANVFLEEGEEDMRPELPTEYCPRYYTRESKAFERLDMQRVIKSLGENTPKLKEGNDGKV
jgi:hypothetical protein